MINIISTQAHHSKITGPAKVFRNLVKGLDKIGYPYVINRDLNATKRLWIHDDITALRYMHRSKAYKVVGPNLFVMPSDIPSDIRFDGTIYLQPCEWVVKLWQAANFTKCPLSSWAVGIDTDEFAPSSLPYSERRVMVYHKERDPQELVCILETLHALKIKYALVLYGRYNEREYKEMLAKTSFIVWHGCHESQGIAFQEAMACDVPILVCDVVSLGQAKSSYRFSPKMLDFSATAAPYFDSSCGIKISDLCELSNAVQQMVDARDRFHPREFIKQNLSLERQAKALVQMWDAWGLTLDAGNNEKSIHSHPFSIPVSERLIATVKKVLRP